MKVFKGLMEPGATVSSLTLKRSLTISGPSPARRRIGNRTAALSEFMYQDKASALPLTALRLCLMTTECTAVMAELATPKKIPSVETGVPSRKTPMKKPNVTMAQAPKTLREGRAWRTTKETATVNGRTRPRATW